MAAGAVCPPGSTVGSDIPFGFVLVLEATNLVIFALLFSTARRRNGFAGLHELASGTRVMSDVAPRGDAGRRPLMAPPAEPIQPPVSLAHIGPYRLLTGSTAGVDLAYDEALRRKIWIHRDHP